MRRFYLIPLIVVFILPLMAFVYPEEKPESPSQLGEWFIDALARKKFDEASELLAGVEEWKFIAPDQVAGKTDEEILLEIEHGNIPRLKEQWNVLIEEAKKKNLNIKEIEFNEVAVQRFYKQKNAPVNLEVMFFYDHYHGRISLQAIEYENEWHLLDILEPEKAFKDIPKQQGGLLKNMKF